MCKLYECDPTKNKTCNKKSCYVKNGDCFCTTNRKFRKKTSLKEKISKLIK